jgi:hypothetical protein
MGRCLDSQANGLPVRLEHGHDNGIADDNAFTGFPGKY